MANPGAVLSLLDGPRDADVPFLYLGKVLNAACVLVQGWMPGTCALRVLFTLGGIVPTFS